MGKNLHTRLVEVKTGEAILVTETANRIDEQQSSFETGMILGATTAMHSLSNNLSVQVIRALQHIRDEKRFEEAGFKRFDDFLDRHPHSPMTYRQFHHREKALESEGAPLFDYLNGIRVPLSARKLLTEGAVQIEGDQIIIGETRVPANDPELVAEVIRTLAEENQRQTKKLAAQKEKLDKGVEENKKRRKEADEATRGAYMPAPVDQALFNLIGMFTSLITELEALPAHERADKRDYILQQTANQRLRLEQALDLEVPQMSVTECDAGLNEVLADLDETDVM